MPKLCLCGCQGRLVFSSASKEHPAHSADAVAREAWSSPLQMKEPAAHSADAREAWTAPLQCDAAAHLGFCTKEVLLDLPACHLHSSRNPVGAGILKHVCSSFATNMASAGLVEQRRDHERAVLITFSYTSCFLLLKFPTALREKREWRGQFRLHWKKKEAAGKCRLLCAKLGWWDKFRVLCGKGRC